MIVPIIQGSLPGMPAIKMSPEDAKAVAAYVRSVLATIGRQGKPPSSGEAPPNVLVGNAAEGKAYFDAKCGSCHSATGDLRGIADRIPIRRFCRIPGSRRRAAGAGRGAGRSSAARAVTATVDTSHRASPSRARVVRIDDFLVTVELADGTTRTFRRNGDVPKVEVHDPLKAHRDLLSVYSDKDMHDVTAYLVTLK